MLRGIFFGLTILMSVQIVYSDPTSSKNSKTLRDADEDLKLDLDVLAHSSLQKRELGTVFLVIKNQLKEVIKELITEGCSLVKSILYRCKMALLKKFESYTMAYLLRVFINGVTDLTSIFSDPELSYDEVEIMEPVRVEPVQVKPVQMETYNYRNPYYASELASLFRDRRQ